MVEATYIARRAARHAPCRTPCRTPYSAACCTARLTDFCTPRLTACFTARRAVCSTATGEHWSHHQTTLVPVVVYKKHRLDDGSLSPTCAHSEVFLTPDLNHSNKMIQHIMNHTIKKYQEAGDLSHVHIWSDGCGAQLKNRWQVFWCLTEGKKLGVRICHNFFQSCHGKGPSDSEGGVVKQNLRHCEFKRNIQINSSEDAYKQGQLDLDKKAVFAKHSVGILTSFFSKTKQAIEAVAALKAKVAEFFKTKKRHTICSRTHHFIEAGTANHLKVFKY